MNSQRTDWMNCGLILLAALVASVAPFGLLVLAYALIGPLHYLTEIVWLAKRDYFLPKQQDGYWLLFIAASGLLAGLVLQATADKIESASNASLNWRYHAQQVAITASFTTVVAPLILWRFRAWRWRLVSLWLVVATGASIYYSWDAYSYFVLFAVLLPTLVHVVCFTGLFMLGGALKSRSPVGLLSVGLLMAASGCLLMTKLSTWSFDQLVFVGFYRETLGFVHDSLARWFSPTLFSEDVVLSDAGMRLARFLSFAYTYHYLNWFSKTSVIGWHRVERWRLATVIGLWLACVALYAFDYSLGLTFVGILSLLHVVFEFPLNWISIRTVGSESMAIATRGWRSSTRLAPTFK